MPFACIQSISADGQGGALLVAVCGAAGLDGRGGGWPRHRQGAALFIYDICFLLLACVRRTIAYAFTTAIYILPIG